MHVERGFQAGATVALLCLAVVSTVTAQYSGGSGTADDPYRIATAADLIALGQKPEDYDKHFILTADINLAPNLPGRKVFEGAVIAPDTDPNDLFNEFQGPPFTGVLDGRAHAILNFYCLCPERSYTGLLGYVRGEIKNLRLIDPAVSGAIHVGALVGKLHAGTVADCRNEGASVRGHEEVGALVGSSSRGDITDCRAAGVVIGDECVGGLVGSNDEATVANCGATGDVVGGSEASGGLVGANGGTIRNCCADSVVTGEDGVGGLLGQNNWGGEIQNCRSSGSVAGQDYVGGLVGRVEAGVITDCYSAAKVARNKSLFGGFAGQADSDSTITNCFWDVDASDLMISDGGTGKATSEMQSARTFLDAGWDFVGETVNGAEDLWWIDEGKGYPRLWWEPRKYGGGTGEPNDPYLIFTAEQMNAIGAEPNDWGRYFKLMADIDLSGFDGKGGRPAFHMIAPDTDPARLYYQGIAFTGVFDGGRHKLSHLTITGASYLGLFGELAAGAQVRDLWIEDVNVTGSGDFIAALAAESRGAITHCYSAGVVTATGKAQERAYNVGGLIGSSFGDVTFCHSTVAVAGGTYVGGLMGSNWGILARCYSAGPVRGGWSVGGLVGENLSIMERCYALGAVAGESCVGGLVGENYQGFVTDCYSTGAVRGNWYVGGLVGQNGALTEAGKQAAVARCYSAGTVDGQSYVGGLVGRNLAAVTTSFWDTQTSGQAAGADGTGRTTAEMHGARTFLDAGWDFVGEKANGTEDIWWIDEGKDYPRLWREADEASWE